MSAFETKSCGRSGWNIIWVEISLNTYARQAKNRAHKSDKPIGYRPYDRWRSAPRDSCITYRRRKDNDGELPWGLPQRSCIRFTRWAPEDLVIEVVKKTF